MTMDPQDHAIEEYRTLRTEILLLLNRELTLVSFSFTATAAILGFAFSQQISLLFLVPLLVLTLVLFQLIDSARSITRIAAYIRIFLEPNDPGLNWETRMKELRTRMKKQRDESEEPRHESSQRPWTLRNPIFATMSYARAAVVLGFASVFLALAYAFEIFGSSNEHMIAYEREICYAMTVFWVFIFVLTSIQLRSVKSGRYENYLVSLWLSSPGDLEVVSSSTERGLESPEVSEERSELVADLTGGREYGRQERSDLEMATLARWFRRRSELLEGALTASQVAGLLGTSRQTLHDRLKGGTLLAVLDRGVWRYPAWQFDPEGPGGVVEGLSEVLCALEVLPLAKASWLLRPNTYLEGQTPLAALKEGRVEAVRSAAETVGAS